MWGQNWRNDVWDRLDQPWDVVIVGGGITGAGILREATRAGLRALLVEQNDFAFGTSSRSSKLIHGGLRYLKEGQFTVTMASVQEREMLQRVAPGMVDPLGFLITSEKRGGQWKEQLLFEFGLTFYDLIAQQWNHTFYEPYELQMLAPRLKVNDLAGAFHYGDAQTDDARLVLRVLREAVQDGGTAVNYTRAIQLLRHENEVVGVQLHDCVNQRKVDVRAKVVINATGAWADQLRTQMGHEAKIRPLRGSHLVFAQWRLPVAQAVSFPHPQDGRFIFIFPWDGVTLIGTTDLDHAGELDDEPTISGEEIAYLMAAIESRYPSLGISLDDIISTFAGVRPVIDTGKDDPSKESRDHIVLDENGLLTITGGKLTTFRVIAQDALKAVRDRLPEMAALDEDVPVFDEIVDELPTHLPEQVRVRLNGRFGHDSLPLVEAAQAGELEQIPGTTALWAELRWAARAEGVVHLEDLLLRRVRLGLLLPLGGAHWQDQIRAICQDELGWDDATWNEEWVAYQLHWHTHYSLPDLTTIPDWRPMAIPPVREVEGGNGRYLLGAMLAGLAALLFGFYWWRRSE
ncbi:MAG: glycerol-3-phosphate dehydrogenase/oxidase [Chloroflexi bacterium]|nr:MAG: glycerol-3-phosphate dehydrogenase/oxidase [Chloroflexota bacterium]